MTKISIYRKNDSIIKYVVDGHAEFVQEGDDIVCSAISTVAYTTINGITDVLGISVGYEVRDAYIECIVPEDLSDSEREKVDILLDTMYLSFVNLEEQYKEYITIIDMEV